jgi:hypothetical protein
LYYFAPRGSPPVRAFSGSVLAATILVMIDKHSQRFDPWQNWKSLEVSGVASGPCRRQKGATMLDECRGSERRLDSLADNESALHHLIGPQPNNTAGVWSQCLATDLLASIGDCRAVDRARLTGYSVGPQRDHAPMPNSARTPRAMRVPAQNSVDARRQLAEGDTAAREMPPYGRAARVHGLPPDRERASSTRNAIRMPRRKRIGGLVGLALL